MTQFLQPLKTDADRFYTLGPSEDEACKPPRMVQCSVSTARDCCDCRHECIAGRRGHCTTLPVRGRASKMQVMVLAPQGVAAG